MWYVHQLGCRLLTRAAAPDRPPLDEVLATGIEEVAQLHAQTCDPAAPTAPGATVAMVRMAAAGADGRADAEYLVLSDAVAVLDPGDEPVVVTDRSAARHLAGEHLAGLAASARGATGRDGGSALASLIREQQRLRNTPGGYWVAQADPEAARHALTGTVAGVAGALLLSDGAALLVTDFAAATWRGLVDLGYARGPAGIIAATRELEDRDPTGQVWPRYKSRDDATAVVCRPGRAPG